jgi:ubiquitin carboxyl-terminal hydrolase 8
VTAYADLMRKIWLKTSAKRRVVLTQGFKKALSKFAPLFKGSQQHDSQELLATLLDGIHEDLDRVGEKKYIEENTHSGENDEDDAMEAWELHLQRNNSVIVDFFQGQLRSRCECRACGNVSVRFEVFMYLSLPVDDDSESLDDCIASYVAEEELTGTNQWYCSKCKAHVDATKKTDIWVLPRILIVHLKRFKFDDFGENGVKVETALDYPVAGWNLSKVVQSKGSSETTYDLYATSNHLGCLDFGHYTTYALNRFDKVWYEFNDISCRAIDPRSTFESSSSPYMLFYSRSKSGSSNGGMSTHRQSLGLPNLGSQAGHLANSSIKENGFQTPTSLDRDASAGRRQSGGLVSVPLKIPSRKSIPTRSSLMEPVDESGESDDDDEES